MSRRPVWASQPQVPARIAPASGLRPEYVALGSQRRIDLATGAQWSEASGVTHVFGAGGRGWNFSGSAANGITRSGGTTGVQTKGTFVAVYQRGTNNSFTGIGAMGGKWALAFDGGGVSVGLFKLGVVGLNGIVPGAGRLVSVICSHDTATGDYWILGQDLNGDTIGTVYSNTQTDTNAAGSSDGTYTVNNNGSPNNFGGTVFLSIGAHQYFPISWGRKYLRNPWALFEPLPRKIIVPSSGAAAHSASGDLAADAATVSGSALHPHTTSGALAAQDATVSGAATHPHTTTGALAADAATVAGSAAHTLLHTTTGALASDAATVAGSAAHITTHDAAGTLVAGPAGLNGNAAHTTPQTGVSPSGGWEPRKRRDTWLDTPTRERMAELVKAQREAMGIIPKPERKKIVAAAKQVAEDQATVAELAPLAVEVAQKTGTPAQEVIDAIEVAYQYQKALVESRIFADAVERQQQAQQAEAEAAQAAQAQAEAEATARQKHYERLLADDEQLLMQAEQERQQVIKQLRAMQSHILALLGLDPPKEVSTA